MGPRLQDKTAVVTGASSGIGRTIALLFARHGAQVVVNYRSSAEGAAAVVREIERGGGRAVAVQGDVSDPAEIERLLEESQRHLGRIDIWANIAGADILTGGGARLSDLEKLDRLIAVDLRGTMLCSWRIGELMRQAGGGVILNMSWDHVLHGMAGRNPEMFGAVKGGVLGFSKCLARTLAPQVRVNVLAPGWIETAFAREAMQPDAYRRVIESTPAGRWGAPEDVAAAALYLASDEAAFLTGQMLRVNGGLI
jgi:3-oxoacyl-[acyl-carrier protein] reductase